jgi:D-methionine transport system substrate-binding protein
MKNTHGKKLHAVFVPVVLLLVLAGCGNRDQGNRPGAVRAAVESDNNRITIVAVASEVPHAELLEFVKPKLAQQGIDIKIINSSDTTNAPEQLTNGEIDLIFSMHERYMNSVKNEKGFDMVNAGNIHVEPIGAYSVKFKKKGDMPPKPNLAKTNKSTNQFRALTILDQNGFIRLKKDTDVYATTLDDVEAYLKPITLVELDAGLILRIRDQFDAYITNTNRVLEAGLDTKDVLFREGGDSPYANILAVREAAKNDPAIRALYQALTSEDVREFINTKYQGAVIPAF